MGDLTCVNVLSDLTKRMKFWMECNVDVIRYHSMPGDRLMLCRIHMKNGFVIEGKSVLLPQGSDSFAKNSSREQALEKIMLIGQYVMSEALHRAAEVDNHRKRIEKK